MPRIYTSTNDPVDYCRKCFPDENAAKFLFESLGDGPDGRGNCFDYDADHPDYAGEDYHCESCRKLLKGTDNYTK
jgi:hypothetical protein